MKRQHQRDQNQEPRAVWDTMPARRARDKKISQRAGGAVLVAGALWLIGSALAPMFRAEPEVKLANVRAVPFTTPSGAQTSMIYLDVTNSGSVPVRLVKANISGYDEKDRPCWDGHAVTVYAASNDGPGLLPGQTYTMPQGEGYVVTDEGVPKLYRTHAGAAEVSEESSL